jgi:CRISP-associated protein Cas1
MSWRVIHIGNPAKVSLAQKQLVIEQAEKVSIPLEDISVLMIDSYGVLVSAQVLAGLAEEKVTVYVCDDKHTPNAVLLPYQQHSRQLKVMQSQLALSEPFKKRLWQSIIEQKILNQSTVLDILKLEHKLASIARTVKSGDTDGREAYASGLYFRNIFEGNSTRRSPTKINSAFNYGYAVLRGAIARQLAAHGFITALGIHHKSELNSFNLADDFIEAFRPVLDKYVLLEILPNSQGYEIELSKEDRVQVLDILNSYVIIGNEKHTVKNAIEIMVKSFSSCCSNGDYTLLKLPILTYESLYENDGDV